MRAKPVEIHRFGRFDVRLMDDGRLYVTALDATEDEMVVTVAAWPKAGMGPRVCLDVR